MLLPSSNNMRAFVIGNGPSLNATPLDKLRGECTFGLNRFNLLGLDWDPTWWVMADVREGDGWWDWPDLLRRPSMFLFREQDRELIEPYGSKNVIFYPRCEHIGGDYIPDSWHLDSGPCDYGGGISVAIQAAAELGRNPIYVVGADLYRYRGPGEVDVNHFHPDYSFYRLSKHGREINTPAVWEATNKRLIHCHEIARRSAGRMGIKILNATVGGALEAYERVDIHEVLSG